MPISPETEELVRKAWAAQIPEAYRYTGRDHTGVNASYGAIIGPSPGGPLLKRFWRFFQRISESQHLTEAQKAASAKHCYNSVYYRKSERAKRRSRARAKPSSLLPTVSEPGLSEIADLF
jgi:hypothetical protein